MRNVKRHTKKSNIGNHVWVNDHSIDFNNGMIIDRGTFRSGKTLESWHTAITKEANFSDKGPILYLSGMVRHSEKHLIVILFVNIIDMLLLCLWFHIT